MGIIDDDKAVNQALEEVEELRAALAACQQKFSETSINFLIAGQAAIDYKAALDTAEAKLEAVEKVLAWLLDEQAECGNVLNADAVIRRLKQVLSVTSPHRKEERDGNI